MTRLLLLCALLVSAGATAAPSSTPLTPITPLDPVPLETAPPDYAASLVEYSAAQYAAYSRALERSILASRRAVQNEGVRLDAVRQLVRYKGRVHAGVATFDVVRMYRDSKDPRVRLLALSALHATGDRWAMDFLDRSVPFERDARLRRVMKAIVADYKSPGVVEVEAPFLTDTAR